MTITELSDAEFHATFAEPMKQISIERSKDVLELSSYINECFHRDVIPMTEAGLKHDRMYETGDGKHLHLIHHFGRPNVYFIIVAATATNAIVGHHILDLNKKYGLTQ